MTISRSGAPAIQHARGTNQFASAPLPAPLPATLSATNHSDPSCTNPRAGIMSLYPLDDRIAIEKRL